MRRFVVSSLPVTERRKAILALTGVNILWGSTFFLIKMGLDGLAAATALPEQEIGAGFLAIRFLLAIPAVLMISPGAFRRLADAGLWKGAFWIGFTGAAGHFLQTSGLVRVSPSISAFFTSLYVPATPIAAWLLFRRAWPGSLLPSVGLALAGLWIMNPPTGPRFGVGEILTVGCGVMYGIQIVMIDRFSGRHDTGALTAAASVVIGGLLLAAACATPGGRAALAPAALARLAETPSALLPVLFLGLVASSIPLLAMNRFQKALDPTHAAVVYAVEPIYASAFSAFFFGEILTTPIFLGGALVIAANVWAGKASSVPANRVDSPLTPLS